MCDKCTAANAKVESVINEVGAAELVEILGLVVGHEDDASAIDRLFSVLKFSSMIDEPIEIVMLARHFRRSVSGRAERANKLQATLEMVASRSAHQIQSRQMKPTPAKIGKSPALKSSLAC
jgi:hypothetical protein